MADLWIDCAIYNRQLDWLSALLTSIMLELEVAVCGAFTLCGEGIRMVVVCWSHRTSSLKKRPAARRGKGGHPSRLTGTRNFRVLDSANEK